MRVLIFVCVFALGGAEIQQMVLHDSLDDRVGNSHIFRESVPDLTIYPFYGKSKRICFNTTTMVAYSQKQYEGTSTHYFDGPKCEPLTTPYESMRFFGNRNTSIDAVSLYSESDFLGEEVYVDRPAYAGIGRSMRSVGYTGKSAWTVFEGSNFEGGTACLKAGEDTSYYDDIKSQLKISGVRSLMKGCVENVTPQLRRQLREKALRSQPVS